MSAGMIAKQLLHNSGKGLAKAPAAEAEPTVCRSSAHTGSGTAGASATASAVAGSAPSNSQSGGSKRQASYAELARYSQELKQELMQIDRDLLMSLIEAAAHFWGSTMQLQRLAVGHQGPGGAAGCVARLF